MLEEMKAALSRLSPLAAAYLPAGFKNVLLNMAHKLDLQEQEINRLKEVKK